MLDKQLQTTLVLGSGRTLVLVNGKRYVSSAAPFGTPQGGGAVDLNNIPSIMIERVEVVNAGGSAVYGSDAIAGVINYILKMILKEQMQLFFTMTMQAYLQT